MAPFIDTKLCRTFSRELQKCEDVITIPATSAQATHYKTQTTFKSTWYSKFRENRKSMTRGCDSPVEAEIAQKIWSIAAFAQKRAAALDVPKVLKHNA